MKRGDVWISSRFGRDNKVVIVGLDRLTADSDRVLIVPISDVMASHLVTATVAISEGEVLGVAQIPYIGSIGKRNLTSKAGVLAPASIWSVDAALRTALDLND